MSSAPPNSVPAYGDFLGHLVTALTSYGLDSPVVTNLVQFGKQQFPGREAELNFLLEPRREIQGIGPLSGPAPTTGTAVTPQSSSASWAAHGGTLTVGALLALVLSNWDTVSRLFQNIHVTLSSPWALLVVIAVAGAIGGSVNGYLASRGAVLPRFHELGGDRYFLPGLLGNAGAGALAAGFTVWAPTWATAASTAGDAPAVAQPAVLTSAIVVSAFVAGFGAARMVTGQRDKNLLWYAVQQALGQPSRPGTALKVANASSARDVVAMTTGELLPGARETPAAVPAGAVADTAELLRYFQGDSLRQYFDTAGQAGKAAVLTRQTQDLPMSTLNVVQGVGGPLRDAVRDLRLLEVAGNNFDYFRGRLAAAGVDVATLAPSIEAVWNAARDAKAALDHMSSGGQLTPK